MSGQNEASNSVELIVTNAIKLPGVKVNRKEFLAKTLANSIHSDQLSLVLEKGPIKAGIDKEKINRISKSLIEKRTLQSTSVSFAAGLPGGLAMAATIPADTLQFFGVALRLAQELAYLYGYEDLWYDNEVDLERVRGELTLFLGVMFGVGGSASALKVLSSKIAQQTLKKLPQQALTKTVYYPIIKKVAATIGVKITKKSFAQGVSKAVPLIGGIISGGLTYASMKPMGSRLRETLYDSVHYTEEDFNKDLEKIKNEIPGIIDIDFTELVDEVAATEVVQEELVTPTATFSIADELLKFKQLLDMGVLTQEEFDKKKNELLN